MSEPLRVAQVMGKMNGGGVESVVMNYYRHIDRDRVQFDFIVDSDSVLVPKREIEALGGRVFEVPPYQRIAANQGALIGLFEAERWRIVHSHLNTLSVFPLRAAKRAGVPIRIAHSHSVAGRDGLLRNALKYALRPFSKVYPTDLMACSRYVGCWLFGGAADFTVVPNGVDLSRFSLGPSVGRAVRESLGIGRTALIVGHVGRLVAVKNHRFLLEVFSALRALEPDSLLLVVGDGPLRDDIEAKAEELGIGDRVLMLGHRVDVPELLQAMDAFCLPSLYEGFPVVGVECQAAGLPILASDAVPADAAVTPLMGFESLQSPPGAWAERLIEMSRMTRRGYVEELAPFDIDSCAEALLGIYEAALDRAGVR